MITLYLLRRHKRESTGYRALLCFYMPNVLFFYCFAFACLTLLLHSQASTDILKGHGR